MTMRNDKSTGLCYTKIKTKTNLVDNAARSTYRLIKGSKANIEQGISPLESDSTCSAVVAVITNSRGTMSMNMVTCSMVSLHRKLMLVFLFLLPVYDLMIIIRLLYSIYITCFNL